MPVNKKTAVPKKRIAHTTIVASRPKALASKKTTKAVVRKTSKTSPAIAVKKAVRRTKKDEFAPINIVTRHYTVASVSPEKLKLTCPATSDGIMELFSDERLLSEVRKHSNVEGDFRQHGSQFVVDFNLEDGSIGGKKEPSFDSLPHSNVTNDIKVLHSGKQKMFFVRGASSMKQYILNLHKGIISSYTHKRLIGAILLAVFAGFSVKMYGNSKFRVGGGGLPRHAFPRPDPTPVIRLPDRPRPTKPKPLLLTQDPEYTAMEEESRKDRINAARERANADLYRVPGWSLPKSKQAISKKAIDVIAKQATAKRTSKFDMSQSREKRLARLAKQLS